MPEFAKLFEKLGKTVGEAQQKRNAATYFRISAMMGDLDTLLREYLQEETSGDIKRIISKLKSSEALSPEEKKEVKLWIVGDADYYTKLENNFEDWTNEVQRLMAEIKQYAKDDPNVESTMTLRGLLRDGMNVLAEINFYLEQKERIEKFEKNIDQLDGESRQALIEALQEKIKSWDF